jgi:uncharacterized membrane protein YidH (DUF202 family)
MREQRLPHRALSFLPRGPGRAIPKKKREHMKVLGVVLMVAGVLALAYGGFTYTTHKKAVDMGPLQVERSKHHSVPVPPLAGIGALAVGAVLFFAGNRSR